VDGTQNQLLSHGLFGVPLGAHWLSGASLLSMHDTLFLAVFAVLAALCWLSAHLAKQAVPGAAAPAAAAPAAAAPGAVMPAVPAVGVPAAATPAKRPVGKPQTSKSQPGKPQTGKSQPGKPQTGKSQTGKPQSSRTLAPAARAAQARGGSRPPAARTSADQAEAIANSKAAGALTRVLPYLTVVFAAFAPLATALYLVTTVAWTLAERRLFQRNIARSAVPVPEPR
jgi:hypothetical protein